MTAYPFTIQQRHGEVWFTAAGETFEELFTHSCELFGEEKTNEFLALAAAENVVRDAGMTPPAGKPTSNPAAKSGPARSGPPAGPRTSSRASAPDDAPECDHGPRRWFEGSNARGPYTAWFCGGPRNLSRADQCQPLDGETLEPWK